MSCIVDAFMLPMSGLVPKSLYFVAEEIKTRRHVRTILLGKSRPCLVKYLVESKEQWTS